MRACCVRKRVSRRMDVGVGCAYRRGHCSVTDLNADHAVNRQVITLKFAFSKNIESLPFIS